MHTSVWWKSAKPVCEKDHLRIQVIQSFQTATGFLAAAGSLKNSNLILSFISLTVIPSHVLYFIILDFIHLFIIYYLLLYTFQFQHMQISVPARNISRLIISVMSPSVSPSRVISRYFTGYVKFHTLF